MRREPGPDYNVLGGGGGARGQDGAVVENVKSDQWSVRILRLSLRWASQLQVGPDLE